MINEIKAYKNRLEQDIQKYEKVIAKSPKGKLKIANKKSGLEFYIKNEESMDRDHYVNRNETKTLQIYINKKFASDALGLLMKNQKAAEKFVSTHAGQELEELAESYPAAFKELNTIYKDRNTLLEEWQDAKYPKSQYRLDMLTFAASDGCKYRSKSEVMIAETLNKYGIPFRYECELWLPDNNYAIYPDFTILNPIDMKEWYWEHFGLLDNYSYASNAVKKIDAFANAGIMLGDRLVISCETSNVLLSTSHIERLVKHFFCE